MKRVSIDIMLETLAALVIMVDAQSDHLFNETESVFATEMCSEDILKPCAVTGQYYSCRQCTCPTTYYYKIQTSGTKTYEGCFSCVTCGTNQYISNCVTSSGSCAACENCAAGTYRTGCGGKSPGSCSPCPPGYYCSGVSGTQPIQCKTISSCADINQYVKSCTATSDSACTNCADNFAKPSDSYWVAGGDTCTWACNIGPPAYFKNSNNLCQQCKVPSDCQTGEYITKCNANEDGLCTSCDNKPELNSYYTDKSNTYLPECPWSCNAGYEIKGSFCEACPQGSYAKKGDNRCLACEGGTYTSSTTASVCSSCQAGTYSPPLYHNQIVGATSCTTCIPGKYSSDYASTSCASCNSTSYTPGVDATVGATACTLCPLCTTAGVFRSGCSGTSVGTCTKCGNAP